MSSMEKIFKGRVQQLYKTYVLRLQRAKSLTSKRATSVEACTNIQSAHQNQQLFPYLSKANQMLSQGTTLRCKSLQLQTLNDGDSTALEQQDVKVNELMTAKERVRLLNDFKARKIDIFSKYGSWNAKLPHNAIKLCQLLRPCISMHFAVKDGRSLGTVVIQLYTEAAPLVVLEFVRASMKKSKPYTSFQVRRIFADLWIETNLLISTATNTLQEPLDYDTRVIDLGKYPHVLSFSRDFCVGFPLNAINFTISFKPLDVSNGKRVGFGRIIKGTKTLNAIRAHGTKNGKLTREIFITECLVL